MKPVASLPSRLGGIVLAQVSKNEECLFKNEDFVFKNEEFVFKNEEFRIIMMNFAESYNSIRANPSLASNPKNRKLRVHFCMEMKILMIGNEDCSLEK